MTEPVVHIRAVADVVADPDILTPEETARWQRLVQRADRDAYLAAHGLVRLAAEELSGLSGLVLTHHCPTCGATDHGRPAIVGHPEIHVSLSHTRGTVAAIAAASPCGIDVETVGRVPDTALTPRERAWAGEDAMRRTGLWARKEAWVKASGEPLDGAADHDVTDAPWLTGEAHTDGYAAAWVVL